MLDRHLVHKNALKPLIAEAKGVVKHLDLDGWEFNSYTELIRRRLITPEKQSQDSLNSSLLFVGNFTETDIKRADGFVAQLLSFMYDSAFLYHFGRVKTLIWMRNPGWKFLLAEPGHFARKKMTVLRELTCNARVIAKSDVAAPLSRKYEVSSIKLPNAADIIELDSTDFAPEVNCVRVI
jgi:hypothetical protein